jgi:hypothetical protein
MKLPVKTLARVAATLAVVLASHGALADTQTVVQSETFGALTLPSTETFGLSVAPTPSGDTFLSDYGFSIGSSGTLASAVVTIDLASTFDIADMTITLLQGSAWAGPVPADLTPAEISDRNARIIVSGTGSSMTQTIDEVPLASGNYVIEISGIATGTNGGTYAGVLNVAAVPEPTAMALCLAGFGLLALMRRRAGR